MSASTTITVVQCRAISPPPRTVPPTSLPLTFLDLPWLLFSPIQPLFFYDFPISTPHFTQTILPKLTHTLSHTLYHFFPLAGKLVIPSNSGEPRLEYTEGDSICLTIAEAASGDEFKKLAGDHPKMGRVFHDLVPVLSSEQSLLGIQFTVFPEFGICMGFALRNVAADLRTFNNFLRTWASLFKNDEQTMDLGKELASHERSVIRDPKGLQSIFLEEWWDRKRAQEERAGDNGLIYDTMRATFMLSPQEMEQIKQQILTRSVALYGSTTLSILSPYVVACAFVWVCWMRTHWSTPNGYRKSICMNDDNMSSSRNSDTIHHFGFIAGGLTRLHYFVPSSYVGNCIGFGRASAARNELIGENGVVYAAKAIGDTINKLNGDLLGGSKNWIQEWKVILESELHVMVTGSPKLDLYGLDFGWGGPVKVEEVSIETTGAISLCQSREVVGGIEIGVALTTSKIDVFSTYFKKGFN